MKKKIIKIWLIFDVEKGLRKSEWCCIWPSIPNQTKYIEPIYGLWTCLLTTKLSYAQLFKWGHSNQTVVTTIPTTLYYSIPVLLWGRLWLRVIVPDQFDVILIRNKIFELQHIFRPITVKLCSWNFRAMMWLVERDVEGHNFRHRVVQDGLGRRVQTQLIVFHEFDEAMKCDLFLFYRFWEEWEGFQGGLY